MKTAGQFLQETRLAQKKDLDDVARITKIRPQFLQILEADDYTNLPSGTVARGFIRNYSHFLNLNPETVLAIFRRDFVENQQGRIIPRGMVEPVENRSFWTPKTTIIALVALLFTIFGAYLFYQYRILTGPPSLTLSLTTLDFSTEVSGRTDPEATLSVNGQPVILEKNGIFSFRVPLNSGANTVAVTATSKSGKTTTISRVVNVK